MKSMGVDLAPENADGADASMNLLADRFVMRGEASAIDLATGKRVEIVGGAIGSVPEQARWALQCERFAHLHHRSIARLVDYGLTGEGRRFEAWRCDDVWRGSARDAARAIACTEEFFRANHWDGEISMERLRLAGSRLVLLPDVSGQCTCTAPDEEKKSDAAMSSVGSVGMVEVVRDAVRAIAEMFADGIRTSCRTIALRAIPGAGHGAAVNALARAARLGGFVPLASRLVASDFALTLCGRSVALLICGDVDSGWRAWLHLTLISSRPHTAVFVGAERPRGVHTIPLGRVTQAALERAVVPETLSPQVARRVRVAARAAKGLPGRFAALLWGEPSMEHGDHQDRPSRVAESAVEYGAEQHFEVSTRVVALAEWPIAGDVATLRSRLTAAGALLAAGRHAPADRSLRLLCAAFLRRHDWEHAARAGVLLAQSLLKRGLPRDAEAVLIDARDAARRLGQTDVLNQIALLSGVAFTDAGRLDEAEAVLTAACAAAHGMDSRSDLIDAALALARTRFWQGQYDAAMATLKTAHFDELPEPAVVRIAAMSSRLAIGVGDSERAIACAADALAHARATGQPGLIAHAAASAAFAHLAISDHDAVAKDVWLAVQMARRSHDPLQALRARLLQAESCRRQGRRRVAASLCARIGLVRSRALPATIRARVDLLSALLTNSTGSETDLVKRHAQHTGFAAITLFAPMVSRTRESAAIADIVSILQCCQTADEDARVLDAVCSRLRSRLQAVAIGFFVEERGQFTAIAADGGRIEPHLAARVAAVDQSITPHYVNGRLEAGAPVRYAGRPVGVLLARWGLGTACDSTDVVMLLATAATAAAPALAAIVSRRLAPGPRTLDLIGGSACIAEVRDAVQRAAAAPFPALVEGESGCGKELVARALHRQSPRRDRPFCTLNCAALPDDLVESELFGHSRGAFTGALADRIGVFEEAHSGTLFLDEIGELSLRAQAKVLRTIQEGELRRVGENIPRRIDVRLIAATNRDLRQQVSAGGFRLDLLYRLDVIRITIPPLRARREDIPLLAEHFWRDATMRIGSRATLGQTTLARLARYDWPGNVRELQNVLASLAVRTPRRGVVEPSALPPHFDEIDCRQSSRLDAARRTFDTQFIRATLARTGGHRARAAQELGVTRQGLTKLMLRLGLTTAGDVSPEP